MVYQNSYDPFSVDELSVKRVTYEHHYSCITKIPAGFLQLSINF